MKRLFMALALMLAAAPAVFAQQQTGEIFGRVTDNTGAVLPGATVTISGATLIQPRTLVTSETGSYRAPDLPIGTYDVKFDLTGFRTIVRSGIRVTIGFSAQVNAELQVSAVEETITVTGESPIIDTRSTTARTTFDYETLQAIPSARDPWVMLERTPGITMDRANVGGTQSGQQSSYVSRGAGTGNNKWAIDGIDITDMSATGASPIYYDFDMLEEMQVTTGGADASQQTGGVGINLVTRSGTDRLKASGRVLVTDEEFQGNNVDDEIRAAGAGSGAPIQNIKDYGFEVGGPIKRGRAWFWGSYGKQDVKAGIVGFYLKTPECTPRPPTTDVDATRGCLGTDGTELTNYNWKLTLVPFNNNRFNFQNTWAEKFKNARDASDTRPIETTFRQRAVSSDFGTFGWDVGPSPFWKASDQHIISDRWLVDVTWSHLGNNFILDFNEDSLSDVQRTFEISTNVFGRSFQRSGPFIRPTASLDFNTSYFLPGVLGGDHQFKAGYRNRTANEHSETHVGGNTEARFRNGVAVEATLYRDAITNYKLYTHALYLQDTYTLNRLTVNLGVRWDRQSNEALASSVPAHPFLPNWLPAITFNGADGGVIWNDISPRLGMTYDLAGDGRTIVKSSFGIYYGQRSPSQAVSPLNPVTAANIRFPWNDLNGDQVVQVGELTQGRANVLAFGGNYDPDNPSFLGTSGSVDPNVKNDRSREFIAGFDREIVTNLAVGANYIWRKYDRFAWNDTLNFGSEHYVPRTFTPLPAACPAGARCETVTYFEPTIPIPAPFVYTNQPDRYRDYNGFEFVLNKRYSQRWQGSFSYAFNNAVDHWDSARAYEDPTCRAGGGAPDSQAMCLEQQYAPESGGSGIDNVFTNAKWLVKASGLYMLPYDIGASGAFNLRQGYPFPQAIRTPSRANRAGTVDLLLEPLGDIRHENFYILDFHVDKSFTVSNLKLIPGMDIFNVTNGNTILARRRLQAASNANNISGIVAPRVIRFGVRVQW